MTNFLNIDPITHTLKDGSNVIIRPIRPDDAEHEQNFICELSPQSRYSRFMSGVNELTPKQLSYFTHNIPPKHMAFIATYNKNGIDVQIGVARYVLSETDDCAEFAVVVADEWQGKGVATLLLKILAEYAKSAGITKVKGFILPSNRSMHRLAENLGLTIELFDDDLKLYKVSGQLSK